MRPCRTIAPLSPRHGRTSPIPPISYWLKNSRPSDAATMARAPLPDVGMSARQRKCTKHAGRDIHAADPAGPVIAKPESAIGPEGQNVGMAARERDFVLDDIRHASLPGCLAVIRTCEAQGPFPLASERLQQSAIQFPPDNTQSNSFSRRPNSADLLPPSPRGRILILTRLTKLHPIIAP